VDFADSAADAQSFSAFPATDAGFAALPTVSFITPSDPDNMTDTIASPDVGSRQQLPADHRVHAESSRDDRGWRGDPGSGVEQSTGQRMHALATTENLYGLTPFGESAGATVLDFTSATPLTAASSVVAARLRDL
jgi:hypothetical protein